jgi:hypothetical protein
MEYFTICSRAQVAIPVVTPPRHPFRSWNLLTSKSALDDSPHFWGLGASTQDAATNGLPVYEAESRHD